MQNFSRGSKWISFDTSSLREGASRPNFDLGIRGSRDPKRQPLFRGD
jgi:hypothetical protein